MESLATVTQKFQVFVHTCLRRVFSVFFGLRIDLDLSRNRRQLPVDVLVRRWKWQLLFHRIEPDFPGRWAYVPRKKIDSLVLFLWQVHHCIYSQVWGSYLFSMIGSFPNRVVGLIPHPHFEGQLVQFFPVSGVEDLTSSPCVCCFPFRKRLPCGSGSTIF